MRNYIQKVLVNLKKIRKSKISYSQCGEDLIVDFIFNSLSITNPTYLDIGAHYPKYLSNTYFFYKKGAYGVCVEPDPDLFKQLTQVRKRDVCLNVGVGLNAVEAAPFYLMTTSSLNTFSKEEAERYSSYGHQKIEKVINVQMKNINVIIETHLSGKFNYLSLDVEGMDFEVLKSLDLVKYRPEVICVETLQYTENNSERKIEDIKRMMIKHNYMVYADTYINTIFVDKDVWKNR